MVKREALEATDFLDVATVDSEPCDPIHPGEHLAEYLKSAGISQYRLAKAVHVPPRRINEIVRGKRSISADTAVRLGKFFGTSGMFWMNLQAVYDLERARAAISDLDAMDTIAA